MADSAGGAAPVEQILSKREILDSKSSVEMGRGPAAYGRAPLDSSFWHQGLASAQQVGGAGAAQARFGGGVSLGVTPPLPGVLETGVNFIICTGATRRSA